MTVQIVSHLRSVMRCYASHNFVVGRINDVVGSMNDVAGSNNVIVERMNDVAGSTNVVIECMNVNYTTYNFNC